MKFLTGILLLANLAIPLLATVPSLAGDENFLRGVEAYKAGRFELASTEFGAAVEKKPAPGTLLNLGLAEWQGGRIGEAVLAWEKAAWLNPFDRAIAQNLAHARETVSVNPPELAWYEEASTWLPANWWTAIAGGSLWLAVALVTLPGFLRIRKAGWHQTVSAISLGVFLFSLAPSVGVITRSNLAVVLADGTRLLLTPTHSAESITSLPPGEVVRVSRVRGDFLLVHAQSGDGWIQRGRIGFLVPNPH